MKGIKIEMKFCSELWPTLTLRSHERCRIAATVVQRESIGVPILNTQGSYKPHFYIDPKPKQYISAYYIFIKPQTLNPVSCLAAASAVPPLEAGRGGPRGGGVGVEGWAS